MKKILLFFICITTIGHSQSNQPVQWSRKTKKISNEVYELIVNTTIEPGYYLYSQQVPENGPLPTVFTFHKSRFYKLIDTVTEEKGKVKYDPVFEMNIKSFAEHSTFKQRIKIKGKKKRKIIAKVEFMTCNNLKCIRGKETLEFVF